jgi:hypothetical protein
LLQPLNDLIFIERRDRTPWEEQAMSRQYALFFLDGIFLMNNALHRNRQPGHRRHAAL